MSSTELSGPVPAPSRSGTGTRCGACGAPTGSGVLLCRTDTAGLTGALESLAGSLVADLELTRSRQDRTSPVGPRTSGGTDGGLPWNDHASGVLAVVRATVTAWAVEVWHTDPSRRDPLRREHRENLPELTRWLRRNVIVLRTHAEAGRAHRQITAVAARARRAIDIPQTSSRFVVGPCPVDVGPLTDSAPCPGIVHARIGATESSPSVMVCDTDGAHTWGTSEWYRAGKRIQIRRETLRRRAA